MNTAKILFFHGGPGLNSSPEAEVISPIARRMNRSIYFWNEPSLSRPWGDLFDLNNGFMSWYQSADKFIQSHSNEDMPLHIVAHSFSALPLCYLAKKHERKIQQLTLISPIFSLKNFHNKLINQVIEAYASFNFNKAAQIADLREQSSSVFDQPMEQALRMVMATNWYTDFLFNFRTTKCLWLYHLQKSQNSNLDRPTWSSVNRDFDATQLKSVLKDSVDVPTRIILGAEDKLLERDELDFYGQLNFAYHNIFQVRACSHYAHLEDPRIIFDSEFAIH